LNDPLEKALSELPKLKRELFGIIMLVLLGATLFVSWNTLTLFENKLSPLIAKKVELVADQIAADLSLAAQNQIPLSKIPDLKPYSDKVIEQYPEIQRIFVVERNIDLLSETRPSQASDISIKIKGLPDAWVGIVIDRKFIQKSMENILFDIGILLFVGVILCIEITLSLVAFNVLNPLTRFKLLLESYEGGDFSRLMRLRGQDAVAHSTRLINRAIDEVISLAKSKLGSEHSSKAAENRSAFEGLKLGSAGSLQQRSVTDVRIPLFIFVFADELQKSFMPVFVKETGTSLDFLPLDVLLGLPIMVFMAMIAIFTPVAGRWSDRFGSRKIYICGLIPAFGGHIVCAFSGDVIWIVCGRALSGFGYAMIVICCQGYIAGIIDSKERSVGMAAFVGILMSASMAGIAIGGILVERIGYQNIFILSAGLVLMAGLLAFNFFVSEEDSGGGADKPAETSFLKILSNTKFLVTILMSAIPAKIILTGFIYFIIPLYLFKLGSSSAETARVMMVYPILVIALGPLSAWVAGHGSRTFKVLVFGCFLSGVGLIIFHENQTLLAVIFMVVLMGIAHAFMKAPQISFVMEIAETEMPEQGRTAILGLLRTLERIGSVIGPLLAGALVASVGFSNAILVIGCLVSGSALVLLGYFSRLKFDVIEGKDG
jgi:MFS family permease